MSVCLNMSPVSSIMHIQAQLFHAAHCEAAKFLNLNFGTLSIITKYSKTFHCVLHLNVCLNENYPVKIFENLF